MMEIRRLHDLLSRFPRVRVLAIGDFFLDRYLFIDPALAEVSIETGLSAHQVVGRRLSPGAAGTVTSNLKAIGAGTVRALGFTGDDGEGFELRRGLTSAGVDVSLLITTEERSTPTYTKPMLLQPNASAREMERQDIKNRDPLPEHLEIAIIEKLNEVATEVDVIVVSDQVQERNCGVITDRVRDELEQLAESRLVVVDSRVRTAEFGPATVIKPNKAEAAHAAGLDTEQTDMDAVIEAGKVLSADRKAPFFVTLGPDGILAINGRDIAHAPALPVEGDIDIVGAGDSCLSAIACTLAAGGTPAEAAALANLAAAVTIRKIGETGTASPREILAIAEKYIAR